MINSYQDPYARGERIRTLRTDKKMTIQHVADCLGVDKSTFSRYESGRTERISLSILEKLAIILGTTYEYLQFGQTEKPETETIIKNTNSGALHAPIPDYVNIQTSAIAQARVYTAQELSDAAASGFIPEALFALKAENADMSPRINPGDLLLIQPCRELTAGKVNIFLSEDKGILIRDVEKQENYYFVRKRDGGDIIIIEHSGRSKHIKQVLGFCVCLQTYTI